MVHEDAMKPQSTAPRFRVWINVFEAGKFIRLDATTGRPVSAVHVPFRGGGGALIQRGDILGRRPDPTCAGLRLAVGGPLQPA